MNLSTTNSSSQAIHATTNILQKFTRTIFNAPSLIVLIVSVGLAFIVGRMVAAALRKLVTLIGKRADQSENLRTVNRLRRYETYIVLSIALIKVGLLLFGFYFWWVFVHPSGQPTAIIGASALAVIVISGALSPILRDIAAGSFMMAEQWYGVGDHIAVEPFADMQGVVERVTLRSTRIRGLNGEIIWVSNQYIQAIRLSPKGIRTIGLEIFVDDLKQGQRLIKLTNQRLPVGPLLVTTPLEIISSEKVGDSLWHVTAVGETAPGREWLIEKSAVELIKWLDKQSDRRVLAHGPLARFADRDAERRFTRTIRNARKLPAKKRRVRPGTKIVK
ncbi:MAG TPA: mechanosensitive ion channel domain-containing protein [Candidatus Saccharimonadia bacterium]|nr:mechanosensitive ion channel domain-containing protein [Candidatus Saccharimonadia bacterium]